MQRAEVDQPMEAILRRQGRSEPFDPVLDVFWRHTRERSQVDADHLDVVPLIGITDDAVPAALFPLVPGGHDGRADSGVATTDAKRQMLEALRGTPGHRSSGAGR